MIFNNLTKLPHTVERAVIINIGTNLITTLAILSALKYADMPVLLIDCPLKIDDSNDFLYFKNLMLKYEFDLISMPLNEHGATLDKLFCEIDSEYILLIDSDLEILNGSIIPLMKRYIKPDNIFGTGFTQGPNKFEASAWVFKKDGYYEERIWIPFVLLKTSIVKNAILNGNSFKLLIFYNLLPTYPKISKWILRKFPSIFDLHFLDFLKRDYHGKKPAFTMFDTGAEIYQYLRYKKNILFIGPNVDSGVEADFVFHYNGMTRKQMYPDDTHNSISVESISENIILHLKQKYNFDYNYEILYKA